MFQRYLCFPLLGYTMLYLSLIRLLKDNCFQYKIRFDGVKFPANGLVMEKKTVKWEPSTEKMYVRDGVLKVTLTWLCYSKEEAITDVISKLLISKFAMR